ncbi:MAG: DUF4340 domain-containing protein [Candidatus Binatia bacterium]
MSAEIRRVAIFGVLALILGGYTYVTMPEKKAIGANAAKKTDQSVLEFSLDKVKHINVVFEGKHLVCQRTPQGWVNSSSGASVRQDVVVDFLTNLQKLLNLGAVEIEEAQLSDFGLRPPVSRIMLEVEGEETRILSLGKNNPVQTSLYAQINENPQVVLVGSVVTWDIRKLFTAAGFAG